MACDIVAVVDDLFFLAKIRETAKLVRADIHTCEPQQVCEAVRQNSAGAVILDLNHRSGMALDALRAIKSDASLNRVPVLGFLSHVQGDLAAAARAAGCDVVLARSAFAQRLPQFLSAPSETWTVE